MNDTDKRQKLAASMVVAATTFVDSLNALVDLRGERGKLVNPFVDEDFDNALPVQTPSGMVRINHLTAGQIGQIFDFVVPSLLANYLDDANGGRNQQNLLQVRQ